MKNKLVIIGSGGHGRVVADIAVETDRYKDIYWVDDADLSAKLGKQYLGSTDVVENLSDEYDFIVAIGNSKVREMIMNRFSKKSFATLVHPSAVISSSAKIGKGTVVMPGAIINAGSTIGDGVIINTKSSVDHDCNISDFVHIAVGASICGTVNIGTHTWIGAGATIINNIDISADCMIGAGAVVVKNINEAGVYVGVPAKKV